MSDKRFHGHPILGARLNRHRIIWRLLHTLSLTPQLWNKTIQTEIASLSKWRIPICQHQLRLSQACHQRSCTSTGFLSGTATIRNSSACGRILTEERCILRSHSDQLMPTVLYVDAAMPTVLYIKPHQGSLERTRMTTQMTTMMMTMMTTTKTITMTTVTTKKKGKDCGTQ